MGTNNFYFFTNTPKNHAILPALDAILGHKSAHSFATGPVMAEPASKNEIDRIRGFFACCTHSPKAKSSTLKDLGNNVDSF